jgi:lysine biosynthesis protein LysW
MLTTLSARCPACQTMIRFEASPELGSFLICEECEAELEVIQIRPLKLSWVDEDDYDDLDDFDLDEEDLVGFEEEAFDDYEDDDDY